jgi:hypothetical protein
MGRTDARIVSAKTLSSRPDATSTLPPAVRAQRGAHHRLHHGLGASRGLARGRFHDRPCSAAVITRAKNGASLRTVLPE